jgi:hypothetical protein
MLLSGSARLSGRICLDLCVVRGGIGWDPHPRTHGGLDPNVLDKLLLLQLDGSYLVSGEYFNEYN